jgi:hypothetical protein
VRGALADRGGQSDCSDDGSGSRANTAAGQCSRETQSDPCCFPVALGRLACSCPLALLFDSAGRWWNLELARARFHDRPIRRLYGAKWDSRTNISRINRALSNVFIYLLRTRFLVSEGRFEFAPKLFSCGPFEKAQTGLMPVIRACNPGSVILF